MRGVLLLFGAGLSSGDDLKSHSTRREGVQGPQSLPDEVPCRLAASADSIITSVVHDPDFSAVDVPYAWPTRNSLREGCD